MIGDEIVALVVQALDVVQAPKACYTPEEIALGTHIEQPQTEEEAASFEALKSPEVKALYEKYDEHFELICAARAQVCHLIAIRYIVMTGIAPTSVYPLPLDQ